MRGICQRWFTPEVDLFASNRNNKVLNYVSWEPDPQAQFIDAFTVDWRMFKSIYLFPPFRLLGRGLQKLQLEQVPVIIVAPQWWGQTWASTLHQMAGDIWYISPMEGNLYQKSFWSPKGPSPRKDASLARSMLLRGILDWNLPIEAQNVFLPSWKPASRRLYYVYIRRWITFCVEKGWIYNESDLRHLLSFKFLVQEGFVSQCCKCCKKCAF